METLKRRIRFEVFGKGENLEVLREYLEFDGERQMHDFTIQHDRAMLAAMSLQLEFRSFKNLEFGIHFMATQDVVDDAAQRGPSGPLHADIGGQGAGGEVCAGGYDACRRSIRTRDKRGEFGPGMAGLSVAIPREMHVSCMAENLR